MVNSNLELLASVARSLRPLLEELVFVGGCTTVLMITDSGAAGVRPTFDVDAIVEISSYAEYVTFSERLRNLGFVEDQTEGAPICRWVQREMRLDIMPTDERILGFSNRWYKFAMQRAQNVLLEHGLMIRTVTAPLFLATKLEAFKGRGNSDYFASHDLEDIIAVIDGRPSLMDMDKVKQTARDLKAYIALEIGNLVRESDFMDALPGYLLPDSANQARLGNLLATLRNLSKL